MNVFTSHRSSAMHNAALSAALAAAFGLSGGRVYAATDRCEAPLPSAPHVETESRGNRTELLAPCNGVLAPPPVGDSELVEPAPKTGTMPVIRPNDLPQATTEHEKSG